MREDGGGGVISLILINIVFTIRDIAYHDATLHRY